MSRVSALQCDRCKEKDKYREGGDQLPKGWVSVRVEADYTSDWHHSDLCEKCADAVRRALRGAEVTP